MKPGSVIVDLAAEGGGNCDLTRGGEEVNHHGVLILGHINVPSLVSKQSSEFISRNIMNLLGEVHKDGNILLNEENEIVRGALMTRDGRIVSESILKALGQTG